MNKYHKIFNRSTRRTGVLRRVLRRAYCGLRVLRTADLRHDTAFCYNWFRILKLVALTLPVSAPDLENS